MFGVLNNTLRLQGTDVVVPTSKLAIGSQSGIGQLHVIQQGTTSTQGLTLQAPSSKKFSLFHDGTYLNFAEDFGTTRFRIKSGGGVEAEGTISALTGVLLPHGTLLTGSNSQLQNDSRYASLSSTGDLVLKSTITGTALYITGPFASVTNNLASTTITGSVLYVNGPFASVTNSFAANSITGSVLVVNGPFASISSSLAAATITGTALYVNGPFASISSNLSSATITGSILFVNGPYASVTNSFAAATITGTALYVNGPFASITNSLSAATITGTALYVTGPFASVTNNLSSASITGSVLFVNGPFASVTNGLSAATITGTALYVTGPFASVTSNLSSTTITGSVLFVNGPYASVTNSLSAATVTGTALYVTGPFASVTNNLSSATITGSILFVNGPYASVTNSLSAATITGTALYVTGPFASVTNNLSSTTITGSVLFVNGPFASVTNSLAASTLTGTALYVNGPFASITNSLSAATITGTALYVTGPFASVTSVLSSTTITGSVLFVNGPYASVTNSLSAATITGTALYITGPFASVTNNLAAATVTNNVLFVNGPFASITNNLSSASITGSVLLVNGPYASITNNLSSASITGSVLLVNGPYASVTNSLSAATITGTALYITGPFASVTNNLAAATVTNNVLFVNGPFASITNNLSSASITGSVLLVNGPYASVTNSLSAATITGTALYITGPFASVTNNLSSTTITGSVLFVNGPYASITNSLSVATITGTALYITGPFASVTNNLASATVTGSVLVVNGPFASISNNLAARTITGTALYINGPFASITNSLQAGSLNVTATATVSGTLVATTGVLLPVGTLLTGSLSQLFNDAGYVQTGTGSGGGSSGNVNLGGTITGTALYITGPFASVTNSLAAGTLRVSGDAAFNKNVVVSGVVRNNVAGSLYLKLYDEAAAYSVTAGTVGSSLPAAFIAALPLGATQTSIVSLSSTSQLYAPGAFSAQLSGYVKPPQTGTYTFRSTFRDGCIFYIGTSKVANSWSYLSAPQQTIGTVTLYQNLWTPLLIEHATSGTTTEQLTIEWAFNSGTYSTLSHDAVNGFSLACDGQEVSRPIQGTTYALSKVFYNDLPYFAKGGSFPNAQNFTGNVSELNNDSNFVSAAGSGTIVGTALAITGPYASVTNSLTVGGGIQVSGVVNNSTSGSLYFKAYDEAAVYAARAGTVGSILPAPFLAGLPLNATQTSTISFSAATPTGVSGAYSARISGYLMPPATGTYTFRNTFRDGCVLYVGTQKLTDSWYYQSSAQQVLGSLTLRQNVWTPFVLEHATTGTTTQQLTVEWAFNGGTYSTLSHSATGFKLGFDGSEVPTSLLGTSYVSGKAYYADVAYLTQGAYLPNASLFTGKMSELNNDIGAGGNTASVFAANSNASGAVAYVVNGTFDGQITTTGLDSLRGYSGVVQTARGSIPVDINYPYRTLVWNASAGTWRNVSQIPGYPTFYVSTLQGGILTGTGGTGATGQAFGVCISGNGNTLAIGTENDNSGVGGAFVFVSSGTLSSQQAGPLIGTGNTGTAKQGKSLALSSDGNTLVVGAPSDNSSVGAVWVWTRSGSAWTQQGNKLVGTAAAGASSQGYAVALSGDGNTAAVGGYLDNSGAGAVWIFTRSNNTWTQQGAKLVGSGSTGSANQGFSVSLSADGNTLAVGGNTDNTNQGAIWIWTRSASVWSQQGSKYVGSGYTGAAQQGSSISLSADASTLAAGGTANNTNIGGVWVWLKSGAAYTQQAGPLVGVGNSGTSLQGTAVALSADGNTLASGGPGDNSSLGGIWIFTRTLGVWAQTGTKMTAGSGSAQLGNSAALAAAGNKLVSGAPGASGAYTFV